MGNRIDARSDAKLRAPARGRRWRVEHLCGGSPPRGDRGSPDELLPERLLDPVRGEENQRVVRHVVRVPRHRQRRVRVSSSPGRTQHRCGVGEFDRMRFASGFGVVTPAERRRADLFYESLTGVRRARRARRPRYVPEDEQAPPAPQQPYLPQGGRDFVPQNGVFKCALNPFVVVPASFLPERTTDANAAIDAALTAAGLNAARRGRVTRTGLVPIAAEFGSPALPELFARLRWSAADVEGWGQGTDSMLVPRLLIHIPGHFRELARRAPDGREAFVLECLGWLLMAQLRGTVASAI